MIKELSKNFARQHDQSDCGVACLLSIINFYQGFSSLEKLRELSGTTKQGTTLLGLLQAAQQIGFEADGMEAESVDNLNELTNPAILHVVIDSRLQHYIVFYRFENNQAIIGDPAKGILSLTKQELESIWQSRTLLVLTPTERFEKKSKIKNQKKQWIIDIIRDDLPLLGVSLFLGIIISILNLSTAIFSQKLIDNILPSGNIQKLTLSLSLVALLLLARIALTYLRGFFLIRQAKDFNNRIIASFYGSLLRLPKLFFDTRKTGDLIARMNDTRRIQTVISALGGNIIIDILAIVVSIAFLFAYSWLIATIMIVSIPVLTLLAWRFNDVIVKGQQNVMAGYALSESNYVDTIQGIGAIKARNNEIFFEKLNKHIYGLFQEKVFALGINGLRFGWGIEVIGVVFLLAVFSTGSFMMLDQQLRTGELVAILAMAGGIIPSLTRLLIANIQLQEAKVAFDRMFEFTSVKPEYTTAFEENTVKQKITQVKIENLSFRFPGRKQLLSNISLNVYKGEAIAILGESGCGKSTLLQILQKFYKAEQGVVLVDNVSLESIDTPIWREQIGVVPQEIKIFNGTVLFNIILSDQQKDAEEAILFCQHSGLSRYFETLPQGYLTLIGEEGINLSGGQKQILALTRALWRKPQLILLDEATSAMDKKTEQSVLELLNHIKKDAAMIHVTHKQHIAQSADRFYFLEAGPINSVAIENNRLS